MPFLNGLVGPNSSGGQYRWDRVLEYVSCEGRLGREGKSCGIICNELT